MSFTIDLPTFKVYFYFFWILSDLVHIRFIGMLSLLPKTPLTLKKSIHPFYAHLHILVEESVLFPIIPGCLSPLLWDNSS